MKVKDSQLQKIRDLYKKIAKGKKVESNFDAKLAAENASAGKTEAPSVGSNDMLPTNYGDLDHAVQQRKYEFAARAVADAPDVRTDRIAEIEARIKAGTYNVDPEAVAEAMLGTGLFDDI